MKLVLETERLFLREFTADDAGFLFELDSDPEVTRYTLDHKKVLSEAEQVLQQAILPQYALYNYGRWAVHLKHSSEFLGWCGLKCQPERDHEIDLGYRLKKDHWGKGYATEAAFACLKYGFEKLGMTRITGRTLPGNIASGRVLEKIGMTYQGERVIAGHLHRYYDCYSRSSAG